MGRKNRRRYTGRHRLASHGRRPVGAQFWQHRRLCLEPLELRCLLSSSVILSEVMAANKTGIVDSAGANSDWLEIQNTSSTQAVNLQGWQLQYGAGPAIWTFPNVTLGPCESRVIFCDGTSATDPMQELHSNFNLSKSGDNLVLLDNNNNVITSYSPYPQQTADVSYGIGETVTETDLVAAGATATYYAPTSATPSMATWTAPGFNDSSWASGPTGLGFATAPGFATTLYQANITVASVATAQGVISTPSEQLTAVSQTESVLNFLATGGSGHFGGDQPFPEMTVGTTISNNVLRATGTLAIATSGYYTFGVNGDDGFLLSMPDASFTHGSNTTTCSGGTMESDKIQAESDTFATTYLAAGTHTFTLVYFHNTGGASMELFAEKEATSSGTTTFDTGFRLVDDTGNGGLPVTCTPVGTNGATSGLAAAVETNVEAPVEAAIATAGKTSLYSRITFNNPGSLTSLILRMQYSSGYIAYLNGVLVASSNVSSSVLASPQWNSQATEYRSSVVQDTTYEDVDLSAFIGSLTPTGNVLAIQTLMASPTDVNFFMLPELSEVAVTQAGLHYFTTPTPGSFNTPGTWQPDVSFSPQDGFFSAPFNVTLSSGIPGSSIYYTTDNTAPAAAISSITYSGTTATVTTAAPVDFDTGDRVQIANASPAVYDGNFPITVSTTFTSLSGISTFTYTLPTTPSSNASGTGMIAERGTPYTGPITITTTTELQAVVVSAAGSVGTVQCESYIFPGAVVNQTNNPGGTFPTTWAGEFENQPHSVAADYAVSSVSGYTTAQIAAALSALPSMSIVTSNTNMWGPLGVYANSEDHNLTYPVSFEYFNPLSGTTDWSGRVGMQMYGGVGSNNGYLKHCTPGLLRPARRPVVHGREPLRRRLPAGRVDSTPRLQRRLVMGRGKHRVHPRFLDP